jgi:phosphatidylserine/phosphatidylglycerophosphate/cardiolipin synthase-like enzyme
VESIDSAECCVDIASYDLDLLSVARALARANARGVAVRLVTDSDNWNSEALDLLRGEGIPAVGDERDALMHDKFVVIDRKEIWAGSMNLTDNDAYLNDNNFLRINSPALAAIFEAEFEEMFTSREFGTASPAGTPAPEISIGGVPVETLFAPDDHPLARIVELIHGARRSIHFLAFSFTSDEISAALQASARGGADVEGVVESSQAKSNTGAEYLPLLGAGLDVRLDGNPRNMHHKVLIIDGETVVTGSYNFTDSAETKNDEDLLILRDPHLAEEFEKEFRRIFQMASS